MKSDMQEPTCHCPSHTGTDATRVHVSDAVAAHTIDDVLDRLWDEQKADYESAAATGHDVTYHLFPLLRCLQNWMRERLPRDPDARQRGERYHGWANYETWAVHLWLTNDEGSYHRWRGEARRVQRDAPACEQVLKQLWTADEAARFTLAGRLEKAVEGEHVPGAAALASDLVSHALGRVDWDEVADAFLADLDPEG